MPEDGGYFLRDDGVMVATENPFRVSAPLGTYLTVWAPLEKDGEFYHFYSSEGVANVYLGTPAFYYWVCPFSREQVAGSKPAQKQYFEFTKDAGRCRQAVRFETSGWSLK